MYVKDPPDQSENNWVWSPQWEVAMHKPEMWGYVQVRVNKCGCVDVADPRDLE